MKCPYCSAADSKVIDTREVGSGIRRRRECLHCRQRFTTYERVASIHIMVLKNDGRREEFSHDKLFKSIQVACVKRPISMEQIEQTVNEIEAALFGLGSAEITSAVIGQKVIERLREMDDVAYVRFASVYRKFADVDSLAEEIRVLKERKQREEEEKAQLKLSI
ncbi:MAG: transcriptional repressor NrdR [Chloroflexi bacterium]|nr:transcriptional repressor NrdR [Chloroflexota bacterium]MBI3734412.1 transcriptional repressor NrdR [Chloroflexota bacterium]